MFSSPQLDLICRQMLRCISLASIMVWGSGISSLEAETEKDRLLNLSSRAWVGSGEDVLIAGFSIAAGPEKRVLVRAIGPALTGFGVPNAVNNPTLKIVDVDGEIVATNEFWPEVLADTFSDLGAFGLSGGSADAAMVVQLKPGNYTAVAEAKDGFGFGMGLIEVYDLEGPTRLKNLSTRADIEPGRNMVVAGLVVAEGGGDRRLLIRAVGPTLSDFGVTRALPDPVLAVVRQSDGVQIATNDDWAVTNDASVLEQAFAVSGAFPLPRASADAGVLMELGPGAYTVLVSGKAIAAGTALVEVYDLTPDEGATVSLAVSVASTDTAPGATPAVVSVRRIGNIDTELSVKLAYGGTAQMGTDYSALPTTVTIPAGEASVSLSIEPFANTNVQTFNKTVAVALGSGAGYESGLSSSAVVNIYYSAGTLFVAKLIPQALTSNAYGTVTIQLSSDERALVVSSRISNLSSPETAAYLRLGAPGEDGTLLFRLPGGQATNVQWQITGVGTYSAAEVRAALRDGRIFASVGTTNFPNGELAGTAVRYAGSRTFTAPPAAPVEPLASSSEADAARFLTQTTFGGKRSEIDALMGQSYEAWIDAQMALPPSNHLAETRAELERFGEPNFADRPDQQHRYGAWWNITLRGEDQLRQRVAFALSEFLVISDVNGTIYNWQEGAAHYLDLLAEHAFGNYRDLLEEVTLSPAMGVYLSHLRNAKSNPETGSKPDENFAREIMQLFTIGLVELHPDGTLRLDANGLPIPTYDQQTITEMAKVFTGWAFYHEDPQTWRFRWAEQEFLRPMINYPEFHEDGAKTIVTGRELPAGQGAWKDLRDTLDTLFEHENTGPFVARRLIQRLVTSNPSPGYIYRVAQVFANNSHDVRGDLGAVVKAILLDAEARGATAAPSPNFGKIKEPLLRVTGLVRSLNGQSASGRFYYFWSQGELSQGPLRAPSVFNFFTPDYAPVGDIARAGLFAPEMQIHTDTTALSVPNRLSVYSFSNWGDPADREEDGIGLDIEDWVPLYGTPAVILDELDLLLCAGTLSESTRARILQAITDLPSWISPRQGISSMIYLVATSPAAAVQN